jgi:hypothetical protein
MNRLVLTPEEQAAVDDYRTVNNVQPTDTVVDGTNLVIDDHLRVDNAWDVAIVGGTGMFVIAIIPAWGGMILEIDLLNFVTDRAGPNGQTMPIYDPQQELARAAKVAPPVDPKLAAKDERTDRRGLRKALRDAIERLPADQQKHARQVIRAAGALGKDDDA